MFRNLIFYLLSSFAMILLFVSPGPIFNYSSFIFYAMSGAALFIILAFFFYYKRFFSNTIEKQLEVISTMDSNGWASWLSNSSPYLTRIFAASTPYTIGIASISNGIHLWISQISFIKYVSVVVLSAQGILMLLLFMAVIYNYLFGNTKQATDITLQN